MDDLDLDDVDVEEWPIDEVGDLVADSQMHTPLVTVSVEEQDLAPANPLAWT